MCYICTLGISPIHAFGGKEQHVFMGGFGTMDEAMADGFISYKHGKIT